jgi:hypothetical protein
LKYAILRVKLWLAGDFLRCTLLVLVLWSNYRYREPLDSQQGGRSDLSLYSSGNRTRASLRQCIYSDSKKSSRSFQQVRSILRLWFANATAVRSECNVRYGQSAPPRHHENLQVSRQEHTTKNSLRNVSANTQYSTSMTAN